MTSVFLRRVVVALALAGSAMGAAQASAQSAATSAAQVQPDPTEVFLKSNRVVKGVVETASGLQYQVLTPGAGTARPTDADVTLIQYEGRLTNGTVFDKTEQPTPLPVTAVVPGFSEALKLMPKGGKYRFWIKPSLAYGEEATGPIPAHSILVFDIELIDFLPEAVVRQMMLEQQQAGAPPPSGAAQP